MKLFGKFQEYSIHDIMLYGVPTHILRDIIEKHPGVEISVKELKPRKIKKDGELETTIIHPEMSNRHRVIVVENLGFAKISLYSCPMNHYGIKAMGLKPIPEIVKKERIEETMQKLDTENNQRRRHVEHIQKK